MQLTVPTKARRSIIHVPHDRAPATSVVRVKAPLRLSFAGGGTDVEPYLSERGGAVLSTTINKYAYGSMYLREDCEISMTSLDLDVVAKYNIDEPLTFDGNLDLVKAVIRRLHRTETRQGLDFFLHSDAPPGSGLGSSSAVMVAMIGLFCHQFHLPLSRYEIADLAYQLERVDLGIKGGKQDQYAAAFGGFNFIEFTGEGTIVNPLRIPADVLNELNYNLLLFYTGRTRLSAQIIDAQVANYVRRENDIVAAMDELKEIAVALKNALVRGRLDEFGWLLHQAWLNKKQMAAQISNDQIDELYEVARRHGAQGGKITGAGGGGYMLIYCPFGTRHVIAAALEKLGAQVVDFDFEPGGLQTWTVP